MENEHKFYEKDIQGTWLVRCDITGGSFSTMIWRNELFKKNMCPCCGRRVIAVTHKDRKEE